ncbi:MAG: hypothetical protein A3H28_12315 [Acidobacteria bacterium RIFCSPLOWO2_02_FULL_61_28]|nr:MAG: hypothetical protein A3H28_12315 [Acidobacteria bacterium RIFCSPLOWO2_02_FULL_61_28]
MPYDDPDPADPNILVGVQIPAEEGSETEMAYVFAEEFARLGYSEERLLALFHEPFYAGANRALQILGEETIQSIIRETLAVWGRCQLVIEEAPSQKAWDVSLESLQSVGNPEPRGKNEVSHESSL